ncbi:MAG: amidohydrolase family protein [Chloroflexi bacterium]|nr:amidohydrolase family protein [Chloroflexota bacterium]
MATLIPTPTSIPSAAGHSIAWPREREIPPQGAPLPAGTVVVSADSHIMESADLWKERLPARFKDDAPRLWWDDDGFSHLEAEGRLLDVPGLNTMLVEGRVGMADLDERLRDLDAEGVDKEIIFPQRTLSLVGLQNLELRDACMKAYNEWLADYCKGAPERLYGVGILNWWQPEAARDNLQALRAQGYHAMEIPSSPPGVYYNSHAMEPLWDAIEESGYPISFHIGENIQTRGLGALGTFQMQTFAPFRRLFGLMVFSGILERHPGLKVVFTEGGCHWVPAALFDADRIYRDFESEVNPKLANPPSYYWWKNCYATFQEDPVGLKLLDDTGPHKVLWASDYPHPESTLGYTARTIRDIFAATTVQNAKKIVGGTAVEIWDL